MSESLGNSRAASMNQGDPCVSNANVELTELEKQKFIKKFGFSPSVQDVLVKPQSLRPGSVTVESKKPNVGSVSLAIETAAMLRRLSALQGEEFNEESASEIAALSEVKVRRRTAVIDDSEDEEVAIDLY